MQWCCTFCCDIVAFFAVMVLQSHSPSPLMYFSIYRPFSFVFYEAFIILTIIHILGIIIALDKCIGQ